MKTKIIILTAVFSLISLAAISNRAYSDLVVKNYDRGNLTIEIDRRIYHVQDNITISGLRRGSYPVTIYRKVYGRHGSKGKIFIYRGQIDIPAHSRVYGVINSHGNFRVDRVSRHSHHTQAKVYIHKKTQRKTYVVNGHCHEVRRFNIPCEREFDHVIYKIDRESFNKDKFSVARSYLARYDFTSDQIYEVMMRLSFEDSRLRFAKLAYRNCADPHNFDLTFDALTFRSSKRELEDYVFARR